jgi:hypothetical protein
VFQISFVLTELDLLSVPTLSYAYFFFVTVIAGSLLIYRNFTELFSLAGCYCSDLTLTGGANKY